MTEPLDSNVVAWLDSYFAGATVLSTVVAAVHLSAPRAFELLAETGIQIRRWELDQLNPRQYADLADAIRLGCETSTPREVARHYGVAVPAVTHLITNTDVAPRPPSPPPTTDGTAVHEHRTAYPAQETTITVTAPHPATEQADDQAIPQWVPGGAARAALEGGTDETVEVVLHDLTLFWDHRGEAMRARAALWPLALLHHRQGRTTQALDVCERMLGTGEPADHGQLALARCRTAAILLAHNRVAPAIDQLTAADRHLADTALPDPDVQADVAMMLAFAYRAQHLIRQVQRHFGRACRWLPDGPSATYAGTAARILSRRALPLPPEARSLPPGTQLPWPDNECDAARTWLAAFLRRPTAGHTYLACPDTADEVSSHNHTTAFHPAPDTDRK
ncbi:hypothetical protein [Amycolatopsis sp. H20-H5]|uniref:hypothetical protein n=1 Tax=Amycolatopsis sp. H20-H5 TaxID=3046309 RepID=UPI002DBA51AE|nr:hypothetical protein [Amycolatopsis sp. H20-H5]MEC3977773.1 hypothetical protein [Amycolatopsis sp. H20-H5]